MPGAGHNGKGRMPAMRLPHPGKCGRKVPALGFRHQEIAEHLDAGNRFQLFRIDEIGIEPMVSASPNSCTRPPFSSTM